MATMLTTQDNPFDPFTQFDDWFEFDEKNGYHSCQLLARVAKVSDELSNADYNAEVERAINFLIEYDPIGILKKVSSSDDENS